MISKIVKNDFTGLNNFVKAINDKHVVKVGILAGKTHRADTKAAVSLSRTRDTVVQVNSDSRNAKAGVFAKSEGLSNADLGAIHEFGLGNSPERSWLRLPLHKKAAAIVAMAGKGAAQFLAMGRMLEVLKRLGIGCEVAIIDGFETDGWGSWPPNSDSTIRKKGSSAPLVESGQLKRATTSAVDMPS